MKNLKLFIFLILFSFVFASHATAQLGLKAGYNLSSLKYSSVTGVDFNEEFISGYQVGLVYRLGLGDKISFQPEAAYYTNGGRMGNDNQSSISENRIQNVKLNGLVNFNLIGNNDGLSIHLTGGLFASYAVDGTISLESDAGDSEGAIEFGENSFPRTNLGYIFGVGIKVNSFIISVRSSIGAVKLLNLELRDLNGNSLGSSSNKSIEYSFIAAYLF